MAVLLPCRTAAGLTGRPGPGTHPGRPYWVSSGTRAGDLAGRARLLHDRHGLAAALQVPGVVVVLADRLDLHRKLVHRVARLPFHLVGHASELLGVEDVR